MSARGEELRRGLTASGSFEIEGPYRATSGTPFTARWTASAGARSYNVSLNVGITTGQIEIKVVRTLPMFFESASEAPPEGALGVVGTVKLSRYGAETNLVVTRGGAPITDARVLLGSVELTADPDTGSYSLVEAIFGSIFDHGPVELRVISRGEELRRTLTAPAAFSVLSPTLPAQPQSGAPFTVRWEASAGAQEYSVMIVAAGPGIIAAEHTSALETTFAVVHTGLATLYVDAVTQVPAGDSGGDIELRRENTLPLRFEP